MNLSDKELLLLFRAFGLENKEYPDEEDEMTAEEILQKVKTEFKDRGINVD